MATTIPAAPDTAAPTLESHLNHIGNSRRRIATAYSDLSAQFVRMGFTPQPPNGVSAPATPEPQRSMLEEFGVEAAQLEGLAVSIEAATETLARQYRHGQTLAAAM